MKDLSTLEIECALWLMMVIIFVPMAFFLHFENEPQPRIPIEQMAYISCVTNAQLRLKTVLVNIQEYAPHLVWKLSRNESHRYIVFFRSGSRLYQCDIAMDVGERWFLNSLYTY